MVKNAHILVREIAMELARQTYKNPFQPVLMISRNKTMPAWWHYRLAAVEVVERWVSSQVSTQNINEMAISDLENFYMTDEFYKNHPEIHNGWDGK